MREEKKKIWTRNEKYDPLTGVFVRDIRTNDLVFTNGMSASETQVAVSTNGANTNLYPYILHVGCTSTGAIVALMAGTATLGIYNTGIDQQLSIISTPDAPLGKVAASTSLSVETLSTQSAGATVNIAVVSKRVPINSKI